jgi:hypothetical protein
VLVTQKWKIVSTSLEEHSFWLNKSYNPVIITEVVRSKFAPPFNEATHEPGVRAHGFYRHSVENRCVTNDLLMMEAEAY